MSTISNTASAQGLRLTKVERINVAIPPLGREQGHVHRYNELICTLRGTYEAVLADGLRYCGSAGSVVVHPAGRDHRGEWREVTGIDFLLVWWEGALPGARMPLQTILPSERLRQWCAWMLDAWSADDGDGRRVATHLLQALLLDLTRRGGARDDLVQVVDALIDQTHDRRLRMEDFAAATGLSRFHFSRRFKALTGESPMAYCRRRRLAAARRDLAETDLPIREVALRQGFATPQQLATLMRARYGASPSEIRRGQDRSRRNE